MAYATYSDYTVTYRGSAIAESSFDRLALRASEVIDELTYDRAAPVVEAGTAAETIAKIVLATCAVAEEIQRAEGEGGRMVQSEKVGSHSVTYATSESSAHRQSSAAKRYLWSTGLMYRGFAAEEYGA